MFSTLKSVFGNVTVEERNNVITIDGINTDALTNAIYKQWHTSKVGNNIFHAPRRSSVGFFSFFAIEVEFILTELLNANKGYIRATTLRRAIEGLQQNTWLRNLKDRQPSILDRSRLKDLTWTALPHQLEFFDIFDERVPKYELNGYLLGAEAGSGKTFTSLAVAYMYNASSVIVVSPNNAIDNVWRDTIGKIYKKPVDLWVSNDPSPPRVGCTHYVVHYEYLSKFLAWASENTRSFGSKPFIILDESHNLNESTPTHSLRTQSFIDLCQMFFDVDFMSIWQSGTPIKAMGNEVIPMMKCIDKRFTPDAEQQFRPIFGKEAKRAIEILAHRIGLITYRVKSPVKDPIITRWDATLKHGDEFTLQHIGIVMRDFIDERMRYYQANEAKYTETYFRLIDQVRDRIPKVSLDEYLKVTKLLHERYDPTIHKEEPKYANRFEEKYILPLLTGKDKADFRDARSVYKYYWLKVQGEALGRILGKERSRCSTELALAPEFVNKADQETATLVELIQRSESKTVVFSNYVATVEAIAERLVALGFKPIVVHGGIKESVGDAVKRFEKDDTLEVLVTTYKSLSTAMPLVMASNSIMVDQPFRDYERNQAIHRTARLGQRYEVAIRDLYLDTGKKPNISTRSKDILDWSMQQVEKIMGRTAVSEVSIEHFVPINPSWHPVMESLDEDTLTYIEEVLNTDGDESKYSFREPNHSMLDW